jgi:4-amino-4-deoxy-L-arabinose transferase-like glycosyltransferase
VSRWWWLLVVAALVVFDLYLLIYRLSDVQGNVEAQFIIVAPAFLAKHWADVRHRNAQHAEVMARQDAHDAELAAHRAELATVARHVADLHELHVEGRLPKRMVRP